MRCPACGADNPQEATACTSCSASLDQPAAPAPGEGAERKPAPAGLHVSGLAVLGLLLGCLAPACVWLRDTAGGPWLSRWLGPDPALTYSFGMFCEFAAPLLRLAAIALALVALVQIFHRVREMGGIVIALGAIAVAALVGSPKIIPIVAAGAIVVEMLIALVVSLCRGRAKPPGEAPAGEA